MSDYTTIKLTKMNGYFEAEFAKEYGIGRTRYEAINNLKKELKQQIRRLQNAVNDIQDETFFIEQIERTEIK